MKIEPNLHGTNEEYQAYRKREWDRWCARRAAEIAAEAQRQEVSQQPEGPPKPKNRGGRPKGSRNKRPRPDKGRKRIGKDGRVLICSTEKRRRKKT